jgi:GT2 family glycosyltransferase
MSFPTVHAVVVSWNGADLLPRCLASLERQTRPPDEIVVVDNASSDGTPALALRSHPRAVLIENRTNLGFAEGANVGMRRALGEGADYVAVLNQDTEVEESWLAALLDAAETDPRIAAVGSRIFFSSRRSLVNSTGIELNYSGRVCDRGFGRVDGERWQEPVEVLGVSGGAMLLRVAALRDAGLFDPSFFAYYEDADLCVRLWEAGYRLVYAPDAVVWHGYSTSFGLESPRKLVLLESNRYRFLMKHFPWHRLLRDAPALLLEEARYFAHRARRGGRGAALVCLRTYIRAVAALPSALSYRRERRRHAARRSRWWRFLTPSYGYFDISVPRLDFELVESAEHATAGRVLMGIDDAAMGEGWYPLSDPAATRRTADCGPAFRGFGRAAGCFLRVPRPGPYVLQLHVSQPFAAIRAPLLEVRCEGVEVGRVRLDCEDWRTLRFPVEIRRETAAIVLRVDAPILREESGAPVDLGARVNEIALHGEGSPLLRDTVSAA